MYSPETIEDALAILPHLIYIAQQRKTITYGELAQKIGKHHRPARLWLGYIRDEICIPENRPYLTAIVVSQDDGLPGESFLPEGTTHLSPESYQAAFEKHRDNVFTYQHWDDVLRELGLKPVEKRPRDLDEEGRIFNEVLVRRGGEAEGEPHRQLKMFVARNPARIGLYVTGEPIIEYCFVSGDECDVVFDLGELGTAVVEVKNGERGELVKGIYQAVKYRALMEAEKGRGEPYPVKAVLVAYELPEDIAAFAHRLDISTYHIQRSTVEKYDLRG